jgi:hypothetical protein
MMVMMVMMPMMMVTAMVMAGEHNDGGNNGGAAVPSGPSVTPAVMPVPWSAMNVRDRIEIRDSRSKTSRRAEARRLGTVHQRAHAQHRRGSNQNYEFTHSLFLMAKNGRCPSEGETA